MPASVVGKTKAGGGKTPDLSGGQTFSALPGDSKILGATYDPQRDGVNFALFSRSAAEFAVSGKPGERAQVDLCLYDKTGTKELGRIPMKEPAGTKDNPAGDGVWHCFIPGLDPDEVTYGYRVDAPYLPQQGHRFNPHKLLMDPYARDFVGFGQMQEALKVGNQALFGYQMSPNPEENAANACDPAKMDQTDSGAIVAKGRIRDPRREGEFDWGQDQSPNVPWSKSVIYEGHVKGMTKLHPEVPETLRGKFAALAEAPVTRHLSSLGVTAVELLPVQMILDDLPGGQTNYWGYYTLNFFALAERYGRPEDLKSAVKAMHEKGIEVILDVVYNHTAEGNEQGPTLSMKGIDNKRYYALAPAARQYYMNDSGCGNVLNVNGDPAVTAMAIDSLRYLVREFRADGLRFDLLYTLGRDPAWKFAFNPDAPFLKALLADPVLSCVKLSGEPWDPNGCNVGGMPKDFYEWNGMYPDRIAAYMSRCGATIRDLAVIMAGSSPKFDHLGKGGPAEDDKAIKGINFVTCHDGASLADMMAYAACKHSVSNGGVDGPSDKADVRQFRLREAFNAIAILAMSHGPIMLKSGDEMGHTQQGNDNPYNQDNGINWLNWGDFMRRIGECAEGEIFSPAEKRAIYDFTRTMLDLRQTVLPLMRPQFPHGKLVDTQGIKDISWWNPSGDRMNGGHWDEQVHCLGIMHCNGAVVDAEERESSLPVTENSRILTIVNGHSGPVNFRMPPVTGDNGGWRLLVDTDQFSRSKAVGTPAQTRKVMEGNTLVVPPQTVLVFVREPAPVTAFVPLGKGASPAAVSPQELVAA